MDIDLLHWLTGTAAILAGLGVLGSYVLTQDRKDRFPAATWWVYSGNNHLILLGFVGFCVQVGTHSQVLGLVTFIFAWAGIVLMTYPQAIRGWEPDQIGSVGLALAVLLLAAATFVTPAFPAWVGSMWAGAFLVGLPGLLLKRFRTLSYVMGGVLFSLGFMAAGAWLLAAPAV